MTLCVRVNEDDGVVCSDHARRIKGMCQRHYTHWYNHEREVPECSVEGCVNRCNGKGSLCLSHYMQRYDNASVGPECVVEECASRAHHSTLYCESHYRANLRHGDPLIVLPKATPNKGRFGPESYGWKGDDIGYAAAHFRVKALHGKANDWPCSAQCGNQAAEWAYCKDGEIELVEEAGQYAGQPYSPNSDDYVPLCNSCHTNFDRRGTAPLVL